MENQDTIIDQIKKAAENVENQDFPGMEKVWSRIDAKLDTQVFKAQRKTNTSWKKFAVAVSFVVGSVFAFQIWNNYSSKKNYLNTVVEKEIKNNTEPINKSILSTDSTAIAITETPVLDKKNAEKVLQKQLNSANTVATLIKPKADTIQQIKMAGTPVKIASVEEKSDFIQAKTEEAEIVEKSKMEVSNYSRNKDAKSSQITKKAPPLVVVDGKATNKKVSDIENADDLETIVELKEPLYIINEIEYSEKEMFGPNPTSPYYPLNKQEIESIAIYQTSEAVEKFGKKGQKGVVVIKTKNGKPKANK
jgi:hypothetical protein